MSRNAIAILDFGSQYTQLIARRVREAHVYCEIFPWDAPAARVLALEPCGFILSGGHNSVYDPGAPTLPAYIIETTQPVLGICYGQQLLAHALGGHVAPARAREYGSAEIEWLAPTTPLAEHLPSTMPVWMSHGDHIETLPPGFVALARSGNAPIAAMGDPARRRYAVQFHPEVRHTPNGPQLLQNFLYNICNLQPDWTPGTFVDEAVARIRAQVGTGRVVCGLSGGVDSAVAAALIERAIGAQLTCIFVDTGLLRAGEAEQVVETFHARLGDRLIAVRAAEQFLAPLAGVSDPEEKRRIIGTQFIRVFEATARELGEVEFLAQGTAYPDVIESRGPERQTAARIKTHHNVGGLPADMQFKLVEPLRFLFKDEIRAAGEELGLPPEIVWRQPFPGPGLAVRVLGPVSWERLETLRAADAIVLAELRAAGLERTLAQSFAVLLPVQSVAVMGDGRVFADVIAVRAVTSEDFMTAAAAQLPWDVLTRIATRITNEVKNISRVVYDISSKPPATIEWE